MTTGRSGLVLLLILFFAVTHISTAFANDFPQLPSLSGGKSAHALYLKLQPGMKGEPFVESHNGYEVKDQDGNVFYVDDIEKPERAVYLTNVQDNTAIGSSGSFEIISEVNIKKLEFK